MGSRRGWGEGSIESLPSGKFRAIRSNGSHADGRQKKQSKTFDSKRAAVQWLADQLTSVRGEWSLRPLGDWMEHWLASKVESIEPATLHWYKRHANARIIPLLGSVKLGELTPVLVQGFMARMAEKKVTARARFQTLKTLRAALAEAVRMEQVGRNVATAVMIHGRKVDRKPRRLKRKSA